MIFDSPTKIDIVILMVANRNQQTFELAKDPVMGLLFWPYMATDYATSA
jgi:hypothetical protein